MFEKIMYKVKTKSDKEVYRVRDFTSGDNVDASKFIESMSQRGEIQLQTNVCVLYKDEYNSLIQEIEPLKDKVKKLKINLNEKEIKIKKLEDKLEAKIQTSNDEVIQLKEDNFNMTQSHDKEVSKLHQEISRLEKSHLEEINKLKETHANQLLAIDETHKKEIEKIQSHNNAKLDEVNDKLLSEVQSNEQTSIKLKDEMLTMTKAHSLEIDKLQQEKSNIEKSHANETLELTNKHQTILNQLNKDISSLKQTHLEELRNIDKTHNNDIENMRASFLKIVTHEYQQDLNEIDEVEKSLPSLLKPFMRKHIKNIEDLKERKHKKSAIRYINTYALEDKKEKGEQ